LNIKLHFLIRKCKKDPSIFIKLYNLCKKSKPQIIQSFGAMESFYAMPVAIILNIKFINAMIKDAPSKLKSFSKVWIISKLTFPFSDYIISNSNAGIKSYNAHYKKSRIIYNGFDLKRITNIVDKDMIRKKFNIKTSYVVGMVASFSDFKDYKTFIDSANRVLKLRNDVTFLCIGDGKNFLQL
ncbi:hypothetical protein ACFL20_13780, partial [Spirochaetota bacterium]